MRRTEPSPKKSRRWIRWLVAALLAVASYGATWLLLVNNLVLNASYNIPSYNLSGEALEAERDRCERTLVYRMELFGMVVDEGDNRDGHLRYDRTKCEFDKIENLRSICLGVIFLLPLLQAILVGLGVNTFWRLAVKPREGAIGDR